MLNKKQKEMLLALMRTRKLKDIVILFITVKISGFEDEFMTMSDTWGSFDDFRKLDHFYADRVIENIFKND